VAKRKITVTVDEAVVAGIEALGVTNLSAVINAALATELQTVGSRRALESLLAGWNDRFGAVSEDDLRGAREAFAELDDAASHVA
jgi:post-segregation antitoxin (ccd killing protein)